MTSWELEAKLLGKTIISAELVASSEAGFTDNASPGSDSEHLRLELDTGFIIYLPYHQVRMVDPDWKN